MSMMQLPLDATESVDTDNDGMEIMQTWTDDADQVTTLNDDFPA